MKRSRISQAKTATIIGTILAYSLGIFGCAPKKPLINGSRLNKESKLERETNTPGLKWKPVEGAPVYVMDPRKAKELGLEEDDTGYFGNIAERDTVVVRNEFPKIADKQEYNDLNGFTGTSIKYESEKKGHWYDSFLPENKYARWGIITIFGSGALYGIRELTKGKDGKKSDVPGNNVGGGTEEGAGGGISGIPSGGTQTGSGGLGGDDR